MEAKEIWWAIKLDAPVATGDVFYYTPVKTGPVLFDDERAARRFLAHMSPIIKGKVVCVTISAD